MEAEPPMSVTLEMTDHAAVVTMRWTDKRNALGPDDVGLVADALEEAAGSDRAALILTGEGAFCAGGDLRGFSDLARTQTTEYLRDVVYGRVQRMMRALGSSRLPTIAAVDGPAIGLGMDLALACDMRFIGPNGFMQQGWSRAGLIHGTGGSAFLQRLRPGVAWQLLADQPRLDASASTELGLGEVAAVSARASAEERAGKLGTLMNAEVRAAYVDLLRPSTWPPAEYFDACADYQSKFFSSTDFKNIAAKLLGD
jgi:2-(1,2-epoxy-1,2-dihydrophenyl)acetyl-CoA isomerase